MQRSADRTASGSAGLHEQQQPLPAGCRGDSLLRGGCGGLGGCGGCARGDEIVLSQSAGHLRPPHHHTCRHAGSCPNPQGLLLAQGWQPRRQLLQQLLHPLVTCPTTIFGVGQFNHEDLEIETGA